ncbi:MAG: hypothetical protein JXA68_01950 [Ignavibacteriales bacterium]|nr:hypothetical protein [Ignavibacteriales bacterium]
MKTVKFFFLLLIVILLYACDEDPSSVGDGLTPPKLEIKKIDSITDSLAQTSVSFLDTVRLSGASRLLLGKHAGLEASFLIKFYPYDPNLEVMPDSIESALEADSLIVIDAWIEFSTDYTFGENSNTFDFSAYRITNPWSTGFMRDSLSVLSYAEDVILNKSHTDSTYLVTIDNNLTLRWLKSRIDTTIRDNFGLYFKSSTNSDKILGFESCIGIPAYIIDPDLNKNFPTLKMIVEKPGVFQDTIVVKNALDAHVVTGNIPATIPENIYLIGGIPVRSNLQFDLSNLPKYSGIHKATLEFTVDTIATKNGSIASNYIYVEAYESISLNKILSIETFKLSRSGNKFTGDITSLVQRWVNGLSNQGMRLSLYDEYISAAIIALKGSNAAENLRPKITIFYSIK